RLLRAAPGALARHGGHRAVVEDERLTLRVPVARAGAAGAAEREEPALHLGFVAHPVRGRGSLAGREARLLDEPAAAQAAQQAPGHDRDRDERREEAEDREQLLLRTLRERRAHRGEPEALPRLLERAQVRRRIGGRDLVAARFVRLLDERVAGAVL